MSWFSNDLTPEEQHLKDIGDFLDKKFGFWSYFDIRSVVKSAMDNTLAKDHPDIPYTAKEIIDWANWNDKTSFLMTPGGQAIDGQTTSHEIFGAPKIDPVTGKKNTQEAIDGKVGQLAKSAQSGALKLVGGVLLVVLLFTYLQSKAKKMGGA